MTGLPSPNVSIVVPTFRRPSLLEKCMKTLLKQALSPEDYEIIIVSDGPDWQTRLFVQRLALQHSGFNIRILELERRKGPAAARNLGWRSASAS